MSHQGDTTVFYVGCQLILVGVLGQIAVYIVRRFIEQFLWPKSKMPSYSKITKKRRMANPILDAELDDAESTEQVYNSAPTDSNKDQKEAIMNNGSAQSSLAERNLQLAAVQQSISALTPLAKERLTNDSELDESSKQAFLALIDTFAQATSSLNSSMPAPVLSNNILDESDKTNEQQEQATQYLLKTLSMLTDSK